MSGFFQRLFGKDNKPAINRVRPGLHLNSGFTLDVSVSFAGRGIADRVTG